MITERSREDLDWGGFPGYVFFQDERPFVQLYEFDGGRSKTLFWQGRAGVREVLRFLPALSEEAANFDNLPRNELLEFDVRLVQPERMTLAAVDISSPESEELLLSRVAALQDSLAFARFDVRSSLTLLSVWTDLSARSAATEVGVSCRVLGRTLLQLLERTAFIRLTTADLQHLETLLDYHSELVHA